MDSGRHKQESNAFLGTADIIARVQAVQSSPLSRLLRVVRWYVLLLVCVLVAATALYGFWRALPKERRPGAHTLGDKAQDAAAVEGAAKGSAATDAPKAARAVPGERERPRGTPQPVRIALQQPGSLWIDGTRVADKKRAWSGRLSPGQHQLTVRAKGHTMHVPFVVEQEGILIDVDPGRQSFAQSAAGKRRR